MSLDSTLRGLAAEIGQSRTVTGSVAAPAKLRHRTGTITAYTAGALTASVQIGGDIVDAPFLATYNPGVGDAVSVLINNGSPLILGAVNKTPGGGGAIVASAMWSMDTPGFGAIAPDTLNDWVGDYARYFATGLSTVGPGVSCLIGGWYQMNVAGWISGFTDGDVLDINGEAELTNAFYPAGAAGAHYPLWANIDGINPFDYTSPPLHLNQSTLDAIGGDAALRSSLAIVGPNPATAPSLRSAYLTVYKLSD